MISGYESKLYKDVLKGTLRGFEHNMKPSHEIKII
jgi:hypothetical protein